MPKDKSGEVCIAIGGRLGAAVGAGFGALVGNIGAGIGAGLALGLALGLAFYPPFRGSALQFLRISFPAGRSGALRPIT